MSFTVKNYNQNGGISQKFHAYENEPMFQVIGPIGKSLDHSGFGAHVAFVSGTGILPLIDFVAFVARKVLLGGNFSTEMNR